MFSPYLKFLKSDIRIKSKKKSVLLIDFQSGYANHDSIYFFYSKNETASGYSLGLVRIYEYLLKHKISVTILRFYDFENKVQKLFNLIADADIIGVNALTYNAKEAFVLCLSIKNKFPAKIIIGGAEHYALDYLWILNNQEITGCDICCTMEGELPLLALSLGLSYSKIGSIAYKNNGNILKNDYYPKLNINENELLNPVPVQHISKAWMDVAFPEFESTFKFMGKTQTGSGCVYPCEFCTNEKFLGRRYDNTLAVAKKEIKHFLDNKVNFFFVTNALLNSSKHHLDLFLSFMEDFNKNNKMFWACFYSIRIENEYQQFERMARTGCLMINVGIEDIIGNRADLNKGATNLEAISFTEKAKSHVLVRALLILGLPNHYFYTRNELKEKFITYMKAYPQAVYRINHFTPTFGTNIFNRYYSFLEVNPRENVDMLKQYDTMHPLFDPLKMYEYLDVPLGKRWLRHSSDWSILQQEIMTEYLMSREHAQLLDNMKGKLMMFNIAQQYKKLMLSYNHGQGK